jgi:hypothetical protein
MLDPDRRRLLDSLLRKIQNACRGTAGGDEDAITAFIARFFQRVLSTISVESRRGSRAVSPQFPDPQNQDQNQVAQPDFNFFSNFEPSFNDQVRVIPRYRQARTALMCIQDDFMRILSMPIYNSHVDDDQYWLGQTRLISGNEPQGDIPFYLR